MSDEKLNVMQLVVFVFFMCSVCILVDNDCIYFYCRGLGLLQVMNVFSLFSIVELHGYFWFGTTACTSKQT